MHKLERLDGSHDREGFDCGSEPLNRYFGQVARQHGEKGISRTFVLVDELALAPKPVLGFFALSGCEVDSESLPSALAKKLPRKVPAARLGRLAVHKDMQGRGLGKDLVAMAIKKTAESAERVGTAALFVDAKDDSVAQFYQRFGFIPLPQSPLTLFMPLRAIEDLVARFETP